MRVLFFGLEGPFSVAPLRALLAVRAQGIEIAAVIVPRPREFLNSRTSYRVLESPRRIANELPLAAANDEPNIIGLAFAENIPVVEISRPISQLANHLTTYSPDLFVVACFNQLIPRVLLAVPRLGALNVHPSRLPEYRGPEPLFWIFHDGLEHAGVTIHWMNEKPDAGDIAAQERIELPDGVSYREAERICSEVGARLLLNTLRELQNGQMPRVMQDDARASYAPIPTDADFIIETNWTTQRAFNFIRALCEQDAAVWIRANGKLIRVRDAFASDETGDGIEIQFADGMLTIIPDEPRAV